MLPQSADIIRKRYEVTVDGNEGDPIIAKISSAVVDRDGEVLLPQGMNTTQYDANPILFWNHDYEKVLGNVTNIKRDKNSIYGQLNFAPRPAGTQHEWMPESVEHLVRTGFIRGVSVGFVPEDGGVRQASLNDRKQFGAEAKRVYNRWKLYEVSVAPLPANQDALIEAVGKGIVSPIHAKAVFGYEAPSTRTVITLKPPSRSRVIVRKRQTKSIDTESVVRAEVARLRGQIYL